MSTDDTPTDGEPVDHERGGTTTTLATLEAFVPPTGDARLTVDTDRTAEGGRVSVALLSTEIKTYVWLTPAEARAAAERLEAAAAEAEGPDAE